MLEMNRNEFERALADAKAEHQAEVSALTQRLNSTIATLQDELKTERAEKASALQQVNELAAPLGVAAPIGDSPRTQHIAQLEDTLANLRLEIERRDEEVAAGVGAGATPVASAKSKSKSAKATRDGPNGEGEDDEAVEEIVDAEARAPAIKA